MCEQNETLERDDLTLEDAFAMIEAAVNAAPEGTFDNAQTELQAIVNAEYETPEQIVIAFLRWLKKKLT